MKHLLSALAGAALLTACGKSGPDPPLASKLAAGQYRCQAYFISWTGGSTLMTVRLPDTTLQVTQVADNAIRTGSQRLEYEKDIEWMGHRPSRATYSFTADFWHSPSRKVFQLAQKSDSIFYEYSDGGRSYGQIWRFYGVKVP